mmetsp:Transcript_51662/g.138239  ORF Transcript_51662/g.138239 Transcript_51662/m.138239 type:complete len:708 (+) Transcript_51662:1-2124(+)
MRASTPLLQPRQSARSAREPAPPCARATAPPAAAGAVACLYFSHGGAPKVPASPRPRVRAPRAPPAVAGAITGSPSPAARGCSRLQGRHGCRGERHGQRRARGRSPALAAALAHGPAVPEAHQLALPQRPHDRRAQRHRHQVEQRRLAHVHELQGDACRAEAAEVAYERWPEVALAREERAAAQDVVPPQEGDEQPWQRNVAKAQQHVAAQGVPDGGHPQQHGHGLVRVAAGRDGDHDAVSVEEQRRDEDPEDVVEHHAAEEERGDPEVGQSHSPLHPAEEARADDVLEEPAPGGVPQEKPRDHRCRGRHAGEEVGPRATEAVAELGRAAPPGHRRVGRLRRRQRPASQQHRRVRPVALPARPPIAGPPARPLRQVCTDATDAPEAEPVGIAPARRARASAGDGSGVLCKRPESRHCERHLRERWADPLQEDASDLLEASEANSAEAPRQVVDRAVDEEVGDHQEAAPTDDETAYRQPGVHLPEPLPGSRHGPLEAAALGEVRRGKAGPRCNQRGSQHSQKQARGVQGAGLVDLKGHDHGLLWVGRVPSEDLVADGLGHADGHDVDRGVTCVACAHDLHLLRVADDHDALGAGAHRQLRLPQGGAIATADHSHPCAAAGQLVGQQVAAAAHGVGRRSPGHHLDGGHLRRGEARKEGGDDFGQAARRADGEHGHARHFPGGRALAEESCDNEHRLCNSPPPAMTLTQQ